MFEIRKFENEKFEGFYEKAISELGEFFGKDWVKNRPKVFFVPDKATYDSIRERKTDDWERAFAWGDCVYLLSPDAYGETCHIYSDDNFFMLVKHELVHSFWSLFVSRHRPVWLSEGLALYLAGQCTARKKPEKFSNFLDFYDELDKYTYDEAGFAVEILVERFGRGKLLEVLRGLDSVEYEDGFYDLFERVYGFRISYEKMNELLGGGE